MVWYSEVPIRGTSQWFVTIIFNFLNKYTLGQCAMFNMTTCEEKSNQVISYSPRKTKNIVILKRQIKKIKKLSY